MKNSIYYVTGNAVSIFIDSNGPMVFAHGCNCHSTMNSGIAREVRERLPLLYRADQETRDRYQHPQDKLGRYSVWARPEEGKYAFNLYTQVDYGRSRRHFNYGAFVKALEGMHEYIALHMPSDSMIDVYLPRIGCGLGGGTWEVNHELLEFVNTPSFNYYIVDLA